MRLELSRSRIAPGKEAELQEWMQMLTECHQESHAAYSRRVTEPGWEELEPPFMLTPTHLREAMQQWALTGTGLNSSTPQDRRPN